MLRIAILVLATVGSASAAHACDCFNGGPRAARTAAVAVYVGRVLITAPYAAAPDDLGAARVATQERRARLLVSQGVKGAAAGDTATLVYLVSDGVNCGTTLERGRRYLIYARRDRAITGALTTDGCAGTTPLECAAPDLRALGVQVPKGAGDCRRPRSSPRRGLAPTRMPPQPPPNDR